MKFSHKNFDIYLQMQKSRTPCKMKLTSWNWNHAIIEISGRIPYRYYQRDRESVKHGCCWGCLCVTLIERDTLQAMCDSHAIRHKQWSHGSLAGQYERLWYLGRCSVVERYNTSNMVCIRIPNVSNMYAYATYLFTSIWLLSHIWLF